jgi:hypothetical protein
MNPRKKQPGYKPLKLKKTAIASLTLTSTQMQAILGGSAGVGNTGNTPIISIAGIDNPCTGKPPVSHGLTV